MKKGSTSILKVAVVFMALVALALAIFALPHMWSFGGPAEFPLVALSFRVIMVGLYVTTIPFFIALWQTLKLLGYIEKGRAFSESSVQALKNIKYCATIIGLLYMGGLPLLFPFADADDAPGLLIYGFIVACIPVVISAFALVLQRVFSEKNLN